MTNANTNTNTNTNPNAVVPSPALAARARWVTGREAVEALSLWDGEVLSLDKTGIAGCVVKEGVLKPSHLRVLLVEGFPAAAGIVFQGEVEFLASFPGGVYQGAGTGWMVAYARECVGRGQPLSLSALPSATGFYRKVGLTVATDPGAYGTHACWATPAQLKALAAKRVDVRF